MAKSISVRERFIVKYREAPNGCWQWTAGITSRGYGSFSRGGGSHQAHRIAYELFIGPIPDGLVIDHLCRNRACVNPAHLEPVTNRVNILRGESPSASCAIATHCIHGHEFTPENTRTSKRGKRQCLACRRAFARKYNAAYRARKKAAV